MATFAYRTWVAGGRRWQLARPIADMVAVAKRRGIAVLGTIGDESHLTANEPEDHTPFSITAWPTPALGWVCACDLANTGGLGAAILRDARAGRLPWLKYANIAGKHYSREDGFQTGYWSGDTHVHLSCRSDWLTRSIGAYDPFTEEDDMDLKTVIPSVSEPGFGRTVEDVLGDLWRATHGLNQETAAEVKRIKELVAALPTPTVDLSALAAELRQHLPTPQEVAAALIEQLRPQG